MKKKYAYVVSSQSLSRAGDGPKFVFRTERAANKYVKTQPSNEYGWCQIDKVEDLCDKRGS